jgi:FemAB-related protein (PEP-CTERM system-associated)
MTNALNTSTASITIRRLSTDEPANLPPELERGLSFPGLDSWGAFISKEYSYERIRLRAGDERATGFLSLMHIEHPLFGSYLLTAPYGSYGGFVFDSPSVRDSLLAEAEKIAQERGVNYTVVRFGTGESVPPSGWMQHPIYRTYLVDLSRPTDEILAGFSSNHRNHVRKSLKHGFSITIGHLEVLKDAYEGLALGMHELGSPFHSARYFRSMAESLGDTLRFVVVYDNGGKVAGGGVFISQGDTVTNLYANISSKYRSAHVGEFFYWSVMLHYHQAGYKTLDLGRSLIGSGNEVFKMKWRPSVQGLAYWYHLGKVQEIPELNQKNPKFQAAIWLWKRLPSPIVRAIGPYLIRGIA